MEWASQINTDGKNAIVNEPPTTAYEMEKGLDMEQAYDDGYAAGYNGKTYFSCRYTGLRFQEKWMHGFEAGKNARAASQKNPAIKPKIDGQNWKLT